jgi:DNA-directed RNA polymerase specialized sigma subunit
VTLLNTIAGTSPSLNVARPVTDAEAKAVLSERIEALLEHERLVIGRLFFEGRSAGAIGEELGKTVGAVYLIRNRAIRKLRAMFGLDAANSGGLA